MAPAAVRLQLRFPGPGLVTALPPRDCAANSNNPKFVRLIRMRYKFEEVQNLVVRLYDVDSKVSGQADTISLQSQV